MKLFSRFFSKAPPPPPSLEERITRLNAGSPDFILGTALGTDEEALRVAAIHKLPDGDALRGLAGLSGLVDSASVGLSAAVEQAARDETGDGAGNLARQQGDGDTGVRVVAVTETADGAARIGAEVVPASSPPSTGMPCMAPVNPTDRNSMPSGTDSKWAGISRRMRKPWRPFDRQSATTPPWPEEIRNAAGSMRFEDNSSCRAVACSGVARAQTSTQAASAAAISVRDRAVARRPYCSQRIAAPAATAQRAR